MKNFNTKSMNHEDKKIQFKFVNEQKKRFITFYGVALTHKYNIDILPKFLGFLFETAEV